MRVTYDLIGHIQWEWGVVVLLVGSASALLGVLYALMQHDLKRLLAYHSIENIGIIFMGLGLSMIFLGTGHEVLGTLGLVAALYHTLNHALFKGLLFLGAGAVLYRTHERDLDHMGGLIHRMPVTAVLFLVGCIAISALPPFNGFVSEWLTFQTALQAPQLENGVLRAIIPDRRRAARPHRRAGGRLLRQGLRRRLSRAGRARAAWRTRARCRPACWAAMGLLAALCLLLGVLPTTVIEALAPITQLLRAARRLPSATAQGWLWLTPISPEVASYSAPLVLLVAIVPWSSVWLLLRRKRRAGRGAQRYAWDCGFGQLNAAHAVHLDAPSASRSGACSRRRMEGRGADRRARQRGAARAGHRACVTACTCTTGRGSSAMCRSDVWCSAAARRIGFIQTGNIHTYLMYLLCHAARVPMDRSS